MRERSILIITNRVPYPLNDGGNLAMQAMIEGYNMSGWKVYLLSMNTTRHFVPEDVLSGLYKNIYAFDTYNIDNNVKPLQVIKNYLFSKTAEHVERFYNTGFEQKIIEVLGKFKPDVIQIESIFLSTYLPAITSRSSALKVLRMHNIEYHIWHGVAMKSKNRIRKRYLHNLTRRLKKFEKESWRQYDLLLPITEKDAFHVKRIEKAVELVVAPFSIKVAETTTKEVEEKWVGYHLGAMDWIPNREGIKWFLKDVWPRVHALVPKFEFYFAGRKMPGEFMGLQKDGVYCMGEVENAADFIADKKMLIVPVTSTGGIRVKILEAMAAGKIVITTPEGIRGIEAKLGDHFLLARKPEEFMKAIKWCLSNKEQAEEMGKKARELVIAKYEYRAVIKNVISELEALIKVRTHV